MQGHEQSKWYPVNSNYWRIIKCASMQATPTSLNVLDHFQPFTPTIIVIVFPFFFSPIKNYILCVLMTNHSCVFLLQTAKKKLKKITTCFESLSILPKHHYRRIQLELQLTRNCCTVNTDLKEPLILNESLIFLNSCNPSSCLPQWEDVPLPGSRQDARVKRNCAAVQFWS